MVINKVISSLVFSLLFLVSLLPLRVLLVFSHLIYFVGYYLVGYRKTTVIQNLSRALPTKQYKEVVHIARKNMLYMCVMMSEWLKFTSKRKSNLRKQISFSNLEVLQNQLDKNQNVLLVLGHYGNWEALNILPTFVTQPVYAVYKKLTNPIANNLSARMRGRFGVKLLESTEAARFILRNKHNPSIYIFIADQSPRRKKQPWFRFLNQQTIAFMGIERIARAVKPAILYVEIAPQANNCYNISFTDISDLKPVTEHFFAKLEETIQRAPEYWLWSHRRWKHQPLANDVIKPA